MKNMNNGSFKPRKAYFSQISNYALRDNGLTLQAKGLYSLIQSYVTIEGFVLYKDMLIKQSNVGKHAFNSAWKELKDKGYLLQERHSDGGGKFYYMYELCDEPHAGFPCTVEPCADNRGDSNNTYLNNTDINNTDNDNGILSNDENSIRPFPNSDVINAMRVYMTDLYVKKTGNQHPHLKPEQYKRVYDTLDSFCSDNDVNKCGLVSMMIAFLNSNIDSDWNINHFATEGVLMNRFWEELYGR
jgi:hypothetical protein